MTDDRILIRPLAGTDSISAITALLHSAYSSLAMEGFRYVASHQNDDTTRDRLERGIPFVAESRGLIVGTVTFYRPSPDSMCEWYRQPGVFRFGQFAVRPDLQRQGIGSMLYGQIKASAIALGATELALDTAEGAHHLRQWYERLGFRFIQFMTWEQTNYRSVVLSKKLDANT